MSDPINGDFLLPVAAQALNAPNAAAIEFAGQTMTYGALWRESGRLATELRSLGLARGQNAAVCIDRSFDLVIAVVAVLRAGAGYVPLDPAYPADRISHIAKHCKAVVFVTRREIGQKLLPRDSRPTHLVDESRGTAIAETDNAHDPMARNPGVEADGPAYVIYTSGSTGKPKGVVMGRRALSNLVDWHCRELPLKIGERVLQFTSLNFDVSFQEIFTTFAGGGTLILVDEQTRRNPEHLWRYIIENRVNRLFLPFVALDQMAAAAARSAEPHPPLRDVITAGEQLKCSSSIRHLFKRIPDARLHNHYGPSETHVVTAHTLSGDSDLWPTLPPIGKPLPNVLARVMDSNMQPVRPGEPGELLLGGVCLAECYLDDEELTRERFVHMESNGAGQYQLPERLYRTGDQVRVLEDGCLEYLGRLDHQVKIRGHRVELGEIEAALLSHGSIAQAAVTTAERGPEKVLVAYYVPTGTDAPTERQLRSHLASVLPEYMVPAAFAGLSRMPMTPSGKIDKLALPPFGAASRQDGPDDDHVAPRNELEAKIAAVWSEVLMRRFVSVMDNFFEIGGSSLAIVQLRTLLNDRLHGDLSLAEMFEYPTVATLAERMKRQSAGPDLSVIRARASRQRGVAGRAGLQGK